MNAKITQSITKENAEKVVERVSKGWKVDSHLAEIIFKNMFEGKQFETNYVGTVCEWYESALWNMGAVS